jgi:protein-disulfide isomerase/uncharacterized membrane protein
MEERKTDKIFFKKIFIIFFSLVGILTTIKLASIYFEANFNPYALPSFCSVNEFIDCDGIAQTVHAQFLGIPLAYWGLLLYGFIIFLVFVEQLQKIKLLKFLEVFKNPLCYISALGLISFTISMILAGISVFEIKKVCVLCVFTYFLNLFIALTAMNFKEGILQSFKISIQDFINALKIKKYLINFLIFTIISSGFLTYTTLSCCFTPQVKKIKSLSEFLKLKTNPYKMDGNILGDEKAKLIVYVYTDYRCPICKIYNVIIGKAAHELEGFKVIHKNLPLDMECHPQLKKPFHKDSCLLAKYSLAAAEQGRFWEFNSVLFEKEPKNEDDILKLAKDLKFNLNKLKQDANSEKISEELKKDIQDSIDLNIDGTPTMLINGKVYPGILPYYELREILINAGASSRK